MKLKEYRLSTDAPHSIIIGGSGTLTPFVKFMDGRIEETLDGEVAIIPFTSKNADKLRNFLKGKEVEILEREKAILGYLAKNPGSETNTDLIWSAQLVDLLEFKVPGRFHKIKTGWDLVHYMPLRYLDKTNPQAVSDLVEGEWSVVSGYLFRDPEINWQKKYAKIVVADIHGGRISATFFRQTWMGKAFKKDDEVVLYGNYSIYTNSRGQKFPSLTNAEIDKIGTVRGDLDMIPIYPQKKADKSSQLQRSQKELLEKIVWIEDPVPAQLQKHFNLMSRNEAYRLIHFPTTPDVVDAARNRIAFDEFVRLQVFLEDRRETFINKIGGAAKTKTGWADKYIKSLPFKFTLAQENAVKEIRADLISTDPMYRLLQGDVGVGKTELASVAALTAIESGYQAVVLAPTDILATQLRERMEATFAKAGIDLNIDLFNGKILGKKRKELLAKLTDGTTQLLVGTHAVIGKEVHFKKLGLVVVDEQHKFSTGQRTTLLNSKQDDNSMPDFLMMTATPIPRTQSQILYGDMDITIVENQISERKPIITEWHEDSGLAWARTREQVEAGHQAYVIAALVEESDALENVEAAETTYIDLSNRIFPDLRVGLMHGRLSKEEKDSTIQAFYDKKIDILVATSVIEVGIHSSNTTCMTILNANRFGLASLHQIRGRVGRGEDQSYCYLIGEATTYEAEERLKVMTETNNGFIIAERDLEIRGEGSLFNKFQSGDNEMFLANLKNHKDMLEPTKLVAKQARKSAALRKEVDLIYKDRKIEA